ncbi:hypothetical protein [Tsukamurella tyrosinosolvens]|uniref:hypothetical protein n=1 Tax=Tsukamurella tyrosinosolvens TaxID=57704 RepID=UPI000793DA56|nr:hypothetical protein [Tsukamurella tyrosinosolvens]KXP06896.1 hypothetical protein AXK59_01925 [Tsukamurella tyrosinosolvens]
MNTTYHEGAAIVAGRENQLRAQNLIDNAIAETPYGSAITTSTARLIAATMHHGPGSALGRFAATGELDRLHATAELDHAHIRDLPADWWLALDTYLLQGGTAR